MSRVYALFALTILVSIGFNVVLYLHFTAELKHLSSDVSRLSEDLHHLEQAVLQPSMFEKPELTDVPRLVLAFYYAWYGLDPVRHWDEGVTDHPAGGFYDSMDPEVIARHLRLAEEAGIDGFIVSWWGDVDSDRAFETLLRVAEETDSRVKLTVYIEAVGGDRRFEST